MTESEGAWKRPLKCLCGLCPTCQSRNRARRKQLKRKQGLPTALELLTSEKAVSGRKNTQQYRRNRLHLGVKEYWMIGYDGPKPFPQSQWPKIIEHANLFGF